MVESDPFVGHGDQRERVNEGWGKHWADVKPDGTRFGAGIDVTLRTFLLQAVLPWCDFVSFMLRTLKNIRDLRVSRSVSDRFQGRLVVPLSIFLSLQLEEVNSRSGEIGRRKRRWKGLTGDTETLDPC